MPDRSAVPALLTRAILWAVSLRFVAAVVAGILAASRPERLAPSRLQAGAILQAFGSAGTDVMALALLAAVVLLWWQGPPRLAAPGPALLAWRRRCVSAGWLLGLTAAAALLQEAGYVAQIVRVHVTGDTQLAEVTGTTAATLLLAAGGLTAVRRLAGAADDVVYAESTSTAAAVFAVDRRSGDVLAWPTLRMAAEQAPVFGVQDEEYDFYLDDGTVLTTGIVDDYVVLEPTDEHRLDVLMAALRGFAERRQLSVPGADTDEPRAYVDPISRWRYLEQWPGWLRWIGRLIRPT